MVKIGKTALAFLQNCPKSFDFLSMFTVQDLWKSLTLSQPNKFFVCQISRLLQFSMCFNVAQSW